MSLERLREFVTFIFRILNIFVDIRDLASQVPVAFVLNPVFSVDRDAEGSGLSPCVSVSAAGSPLVPSAAVMKEHHSWRSVQTRLRKRNVTGELEIPRIKKFGPKV